MVTRSRIFKSLASAFVLCCQASLAYDLVSFLASQGQEALKSGKYADAVAAFKRAEMMVSGDTEPDKDAFLWEMIGYSQWKAKNYSEAEAALGRARVWYEKSKGAMSPAAARVVDIWAAVYIDQGRYSEANRLLTEALEWSEGKWTHQYLDIDKIPYRVDRLACLEEIQGRSGDYWYANTIDDLANIHVADSNTTSKLQSNIQRLFADWKTRLAKKPSSSGTLAYNSCWAKHFGGSAPTPAPVQPSFFQSPSNFPVRHNSPFSVPGSGAGTKALFDKISESNNRSSSDSANLSRASLAIENNHFMSTPFIPPYGTGSTGPFALTLGATPATKPKSGSLQDPLPFNGLGSQKLDAILKKQSQ